MTLVVVTMDANECTIAKVGKDIELLWHKESYVPRKQDAGGQSAHRFQQNRENLLVWWLKDVAEQIRLVSNGYKIIVAGPSNNKQKLLNYLNNNIMKNVVLPIMDVGYTDMHGIMEAIERSSENINQCQIVEEKLIAERFAKLLATNSDLVDYGFNFDRSNVELILVSKENESLFPGLPVKVVRHPIVDALKICVFKRYAHVG
jgi:peptide subunit release factor 1 (eRF1)